MNTQQQRLQHPKDRLWLLFGVGIRKDVKPSRNNMLQIYSVFPQACDAQRMADQRGQTQKLRNHVPQDLLLHIFKAICPDRGGSDLRIISLSFRRISSHATPIPKSPSPKKGSIGRVPEFRIYTVSNIVRSVLKYLKTAVIHPRTFSQKIHQSSQSMSYQIDPHSQSKIPSKYVPKINSIFERLRNTSPPKKLSGGETSFHLTELYKAAKKIDDYVYAEARLKYFCDTASPNSSQSISHSNRPLSYMGDLTRDINQSAIPCLLARVHCYIRWTGNAHKYVASVTTHDRRRTRRPHF